MFSHCPKCEYQRKESDSTSDDSCPACGLIFSKWLKYQQAEELTAQGLAAELEAMQSRPSRWEFFLSTRPQLPEAEFFVYVLIYLAFVVWGVYFIALDYETNAIGQSFLHTVNLVFHEAGHVIFSPLGRFMQVLGGSLFQVLLPLGIAFAFLWSRREAFGASIALWWAGQSLMDLAPYIADAAVLRLPLLGGGTGYDAPGIHDWYNLLSWTGLLAQAKAFAALADFIGTAVVLLSLVWGFVVLRRYFFALRQRLANFDDRPE